MGGRGVINHSGLAGHTCLLVFVVSRISCLDARLPRLCTGLNPKPQLKHTKYYANVPLTMFPFRFCQRSIHRASFQVFCFEGSGCGVLLSTYGSPPRMAHLKQSFQVLPQAGSTRFALSWTPANKEIIGSYCLGYRRLNRHATFKTALLC